MRVGYDCIRQHDNTKMYYTNSDSSMVTGSVQLRAVRDDVMKELVWLISWSHAGVARVNSITEYDSATDCRCVRAHDVITIPRSDGFPASQLQSAFQVQHRLHY